MTSFSSAVAIDTPEAMTDYDLAVFGTGAGSAPDQVSTAAPPVANGASTGDFTPGEAHLDGHRYLMGDGFMMDEVTEAIMCSCVRVRWVG